MTTPPPPQPPRPPRVAELRRREGMTAAQLYRAVGISKQSLWAIERGRHGMSLATAQRIAAVLGVTLDELTGAE